MSGLDLVRSPAMDLWLALQRDAYEVHATDDDRLVIEHDEAALDDDRLELIRNHKPDLLVLVRACDAGVQARVRLFRAEYLRTPAPKVPAFIFAPGTPYRPGACFSCGDSHAPDETAAGLRFGRCWKCALAWRLAVRAPLPSHVATARDEARIAS